MNDRLATMSFSLVYLTDLRRESLNWGITSIWLGNGHVSGVFTHCCWCGRFYSHCGWYHSQPGGPGLHKKGSWAGEQTSKQPSSMISLQFPIPHSSLSSCPDFPQCGLWQKYKPNKCFLPHKFLWVMVLITATENKLEYWPNFFNSLEFVVSRIKAWRAKWGCIYAVYTKENLRRFLWQCL